MSVFPSSAALFVKKLSVLALVGACFGLYANASDLNSAGTEPAPMAASVGTKLTEKPRDERYVDETTAEALKARVQTIQALPAEPKLRSQVIAETERSAKLQRSRQQSYGVYHDFSFYGAFSRLFEDRDYDGFHRSFSVTFDADLYSNIPNEAVPVYAELYLSRNGGEWVRYFSTETFYISGANELDDYEVVTTLAQGYVTGHYDVLIDLYEVGYSDIVATISSDDTNGLYALPLESANYDREEEVVVEVEAGGSVGAGLLAILIFALLARRRERDRD
ncbi:choice-of-anchor H family protein [Shewanella sp. JM162201]|uniref:Choice-of-anchor H family protein n=1 Tax=Shewanella jiangmenensis TaxID=2837387 RepID=A0ABS5V4K5_9GAMM|nr:choice-of-anchor H family protein [Shewanella jiangmenensis]MBT1445394.1 choice-of-anchor H family protein [Shewanella jiangmenensis]